MSQEPEEKFEQHLQAAVKASLTATRAGDDLRSRLRQALAAAPGPAPAGLGEEEATRFTGALAQAVARGQQWAAADDVARRVEGALSQEAGTDLRSERSVHSAPDDGSPKARYLAALRASVRASQQELVAPDACRQRIAAALRAAAAPPARVVPLPTPATRDRPGRRPLWKRALVAGTSIAAGFALLFVSLVGGADSALAETVRKDHNRCCSALSGSALKRCASYDSKLYGPLPEPPIAADWVRVASRMCQAENGGPMIHNVYVRDGKKVSVHFLPPGENLAKPGSSPPEEIAGGSFPVIAWQSQGWTVTACSSDLDANALAGLLDQG